MSDISIKTKVAAYLLLKKEIEDKKKQQENIKKELEPYLAQAETNARGSYVLPFGEALEVNGQRYKELQKTRKESRILNEERAIKFFRDKADSEEPGWDDLVDSSGVIVYVPHIDQDVLWDLLVQDMITQEEFDSLIDVTVSWAFSPTKE